MGAHAYRINPSFFNLRRVINRLIFTLKALKRQDGPHIINNEGWAHFRLHLGSVHSYWFSSGIAYYFFNQFLANHDAEQVTRGRLH